VNCGAIPENLLEAEFWARKAYTGSTQDRLGYFQAAKGGTLFFDDRSPLAMQSKLLRAIQERSSPPTPAEDTGCESSVPRIKTSMRAYKQASSGKLYYRLNVIEIAVPALRERGRPCRSCRRCTGICDENGARNTVANRRGFAAAGASHPFNGNVRELENMLHRAVALSDGGAGFELANTDRKSPCLPICRITLICGNASFQRC
jgi:two-component system response regulator PilR (NtrC family)